jgi:Protein of unknown function (DUF1566)
VASRVADVCRCGANHTVTDPNTVLIWDRCVLGPLDDDCCVSATFTNLWSETRREVRARNETLYFGHSDWRLPNRYELESLLAVNSALAPTIDSVAFPNTPNDRFWSSTTHTLDPTRAWTVSFTNGFVERDMKNGGRPGQLVRGGQPFAAFNLVPGRTADFDGNGAINASDALLLARLALCFSGTSLTAKVLDPSATRRSGAAIRAFVNANYGETV